MNTQDPYYHPSVEEQLPEWEKSKYREVLDLVRSGKRGVALCFAWSNAWCVKLNGLAQQAEWKGCCFGVQMTEKWGGSIYDPTRDAGDASRCQFLRGWIAPNSNMTDFIVYDFEDTRGVMILKRAQKQGET